MLCKGTGKKSFENIFSSYLFYIRKFNSRRLTIRAMFSFSVIQIRLFLVTLFLLDNYACPLAKN